MAPMIMRMVWMKSVQMTAVRPPARITCCAPVRDKREIFRTATQHDFSPCCLGGGETYAKNAKSGDTL